MSELEQDKNNINNEFKKKKLKLDYSLKSPQERTEAVREYLQQLPPGRLTEKVLDGLSDYICYAMDKEEKKQKKILTPNRMVTVNKRETSFEGIISQLENGEDGIYNMIAENKNIILTPKVAITQKDLEEIPDLKKLHDEIEKLEEQLKHLTGQTRCLVKKQIIEMRRDQYIIKDAYRKTIYPQKATQGSMLLNFDEKIYVNENGEVYSDSQAVSFFNPEHVSAVLCNYSALKEGSWGVFNQDTFYFITDLENLVDQTLKDKYPVLYDILIYKIDGKTNEEIHDLLMRDYQISYTAETISSMWRKKIPKLIADQAQENYLLWYYTNVEKGYWKKCNRCGTIKLGHNRYFSKNSSSRDGLYSICKECRNAKNKKNLGNGK